MGRRQLHAVAKDQVHVADNLDTPPDLRFSPNHMPAGRQCRMGGEVRVIHAKLVGRIRIRRIQIGDGGDTQSADQADALQVIVGMLAGYKPSPFAAADAFALCRRDRLRGRFIRVNPDAADGETPCVTVAQPVANGRAAIIVHGNQFAALARLPPDRQAAAGGDPDALSGRNRRAVHEDEVHVAIDHEATVQRQVPSGRVPAGSEHFRIVEDGDAVRACFFRHVRRVDVGHGRAQTAYGTRAGEGSVVSLAGRDLRPLARMAGCGALRVVHRLRAGEVALPFGRDDAQVPGEVNRAVGVVPAVLASADGHAVLAAGCDRAAVENDRAALAAVGKAQTGNASAADASPRALGDGPNRAAVDLHRAAVARIAVAGAAAATDARARATGGGRHRTAMDRQRAARLGAVPADGRVVVPAVGNQRPAAAALAPDRQAVGAGQLDASVGVKDTAVAEEEIRVSLDRDAAGERHGGVDDVPVRAERRGVCGDGDAGGRLHGMRLVRRVCVGILLQERAKHRAGFAHVPGVRKIEPREIDGGREVLRQQANDSGNGCAIAHADAGGCHLAVIVAMGDGAFLAVPRDVSHDGSKVVVAGVARPVASKATGLDKATLIHDPRDPARMVATEGGRAVAVAHDAKVQAYNAPGIRAIIF